MTTDIFIRTYHKDIEWLKYCLRSIQKFSSGINEIIVCIPQSQRRYLEALNLTKERIVTCPDYERDYLGQQVSKLFSWQWSKADHILFVDSDCVFTGTFSPESFMRDGRPMILKTRYENVGEAICWQGVTERFIGFKPEWEYMRRLPLMYYRDTLEHLCKEQQLKGDLKERVMQQPGNNFSEFNLMGAWAEKEEPDKYYFLDTDTEVPGKIVEQHWSWGGITPEIRQKIEAILA